MSEVNETELLPCPFCGGEAEIEQVSRNGLKLKCKSCLIGITQKTLKYSLDWLRGKLIEGWNTRQPNQPPINKSMEKKVKFAVYVKGKLFGYEELRKDGWYSMCLELNPDSGERWSNIVMQGEGYVRSQFTLEHDRNEKPIYEGDIVEAYLDGECKGKFTIEWSEGSAGWEFLGWNGDDLEVVGNNNLTGSKI